MSSRSYHQFCPVARALDAVGDRWALLILRDLLWHGPLRFVELVESNPGLSPSTLTTRMKALESHGLVEHVELPRPARALGYKLTQRGEQIGSVIDSLYQFGQPLLQSVSPEASDIMYLLRSGHDPTRDQDASVVELRIDDLAVKVRMSRSGVGETSEPAQAVLTTTLQGLLDAVDGDANSIGVEGDERAASACIDLIRLAAV